MNGHAHWGCFKSHWWKGWSRMHSHSGLPFPQLLWGILGEPLSGCLDFGRPWAASRTRSLGVRPWPPLAKGPAGGQLCGCCETWGRVACFCLRCVFLKNSCCLVFFLFSFFLHPKQLEGGVELDAAMLNTALLVCEGSQQWEESLGLLRQLRLSCLEPSTAALSAALRSVEQGGLWVEGLKQLEDLRKAAGGPCSCCYYCCCYCYYYCCCYCCDCCYCCYCFYFCYCFIVVIVDYCYCCHFLRAGWHALRCRRGHASETWFCLRLFLIFIFCYLLFFVVVVCVFFLIKFVICCCLFVFQFVRKAGLWREARAVLADARLRWLAVAWICLRCLFFHIF
ncbi:unnamed protein product [Polarella glacialis]|uniref:Uncharacterized protein n=1 Tax=Polarella glacialis TaxID=89957 RepID=A0A813I3G8_POLGL|nr:unnamed protein product [Polarella glacialis]CAE8644725.1 unnamed protein product [Polarella glacialis]